MSIFRTKGKGKSRKVYPISGSGKTYRRHYTEKPGIGTSMDVHGDIKKMMHKPDAVTEGNRDYDVYKKRLSRNADSAFLKEYKRAEKREDKEIRKEEKQQMKQEKEEAQDRNEKHW